MLVDTEDEKPEAPPAPASAPAPAATPHSHLRVRSDLHEEYSPDEIAKMTELYEGTLSNIEEGEIVKSKVLRVTDTAVILDVGFKSEGAVAIDEFKDPKSLKEGDEIEVFLEHLEDQEGAVVLSKKKADVLMKELSVNQVRKGVVKNITDFGAFIDLGGVDGLLHITDMSYGRVSHPSEMVQIGQELEVKVLDIDWERERISLGLKQLQPYPWQNVAAKYPVGTRLRGKVRNLTSFGAFVEIEPGIDGLIHISDMSWTKRVQHPSEVVKKGDEVDVLILNVDAENKRISLGLKQAQEDPWLRIGETYPVGTELRGRVMRLMDKGVVVDLGSDIEGFVPMSQLGIRRMTRPR